METHECYKKEVERILQSRLRRNMGQTTATGSVGKNAEAASISGSKRKPSSSCTNADCDSCSRGGCAAASAASATSTRGCDESGSQPSKRRKNSSVGEVYPSCWLICSWDIYNYMYLNLNCLLLIGPNVPQDHREATPRSHEQLLGRAVASYTVALSKEGSRSH